MPHLEGFLTLVSESGPWFRVQGRHVRPVGAKKVAVRLALDPTDGLLLDVHVGGGLWLRAGWYPAHFPCRPSASDEYPVAELAHRCWARHLPVRVFGSTA